MIGATVYTVERVGIYRQGVLGVFGTEAQARACAEAVVAANRPDADEVPGHTDGDGYHEYEVMRHLVGVGGSGVLVDVYANARHDGVWRYAWHNP